jgi:GTP-binding protein Era
VGKAELVLWLVEVGEAPGPGDRYVCDILKKAGRPVILGLNKIDTISKPAILPAIDAYRHLMDFTEIIPLSALGGENAELVVERLLAHLPPGDRLYPDDFLTDLPERFFVAEMIREKILHKTRDELPYTTGVLIESFKEEEKLVRIQAVVLVERESQKGIIIGKGGAMLKAIGTEARQEIEAFLDTKVFVGLFVKVREHWREDQQILEEMGLGRQSQGD